MTNKNELYAIYHKKTGELWTAASGKKAWANKGHAKSAWLRGPGSDMTYQQLCVYHSLNYAEKRKARVRFDEQDEYEVRLVGKTDAYEWVEGDDIPLDGSPVLVDLGDEDYPYEVAYGFKKFIIVGGKFDRPKILRWKRLDAS